MERESALMLTETLGDELLKNCHYVRVNGDLSSVATLKTVMLEIARQLIKIEKEIE